MINKCHCRTAILRAVIAGFAVAAGSAQAATIQNYGYAYTTVSYEQAAADALGVQNFGYSDWYSLGDATYAGDAYAGTARILSPYGSTEVRAYAIANGFATAGSGANSSSESSYAYAANYLILNNTNPFDVLFPITTYHEDYADAYSNASYMGSAFTLSQSFVEVFNAYGQFITESWFAKAISSGTFGLAGPFKTVETFQYEVVLTPGINFIAAEVAVDGYGFVAVAAVPEPGTLTIATLLAAVSFVGTAWRKRRRER